MRNNAHSVCLGKQRGGEMGKRRIYKSLEDEHQDRLKARERAKATRKKRENQIKETSKLPYSFNRKIRQAFVGKNCPICGIKMGVPVLDEIGICFVTSAPSIQHNIPLSKDGTHTIDNISVICTRCNSSINDRIIGDINNQEVRKVWQEIQNGICKT